MVGTTLVDIREHIEALASAEGEFYLVCGRTGDRPVPAAGKHFRDRLTARSAARATEQYRATLRRYDPRLPHYDVIVCQDTRSSSSVGRASTRPQNRDQAFSDPSFDDVTLPPERRDLVEFCHRVAAAVFETLSAAGYEDVETAVMDAYFDLAETVDDPNDLCLCLLESMATALDIRLTPAQQAEVLSNASTRLAPAEPAANPVSATFSSLQERGLLEEYTQAPWSIDLDEGVRSVDVQLSNYVLSPQRGRLPVLPIVVDLYRRHSDQSPSSLRAVDDAGGWRLTLVLAAEAEPNGLASAPIQSEV